MLARGSKIRTNLNQRSHFWITLCFYVGVPRPLLLSRSNMDPRVWDSLFVGPNLSNVLRLFSCFVVWWGIVWYDALWLEMLIVSQGVELPYVLWMLWCVPRLLPSACDSNVSPVKLWFEIAIGCHDNNYCSVVTLERSWLCNASSGNVRFSTSLFASSHERCLQVGGGWDRVRDLSIWNLISWISQWFCIYVGQPMISASSARPSTCYDMVHEEHKVRMMLPVEFLSSWCLLMVWPWPWSTYTNHQTSTKTTGIFKHLTPREEY